jgi:hypothetical protein
MVPRILPQRFFMPNVETLDSLLNRRILMAADPSHWWAVKTNAKRLLAVSPDPDRLAGRIVAILSEPLEHQRAA